MTTLYNFGALDGSYANADGGLPAAGLVQGSDGNFYGTAQFGGANATGTIFKFTPAGVFTRLHTFTAPDSNRVNADGAYPAAALLQGSDGNFYGTTSGGGKGPGSTIFRLTPAGVLTTLYNFSAANGAGPAAGLIQGKDGNFYGTAGGGTTGGSGLVFKLTPAGVLTPLHAFSATDSAGDNSDGALPRGGVIQGKGRPISTARP